MMFVCGHRGCGRCPDAGEARMIFLALARCLIHKAEAESSLWITFLESLMNTEHCDVMISTAIDGINFCQLQLVMKLEISGGGQCWKALGLREGVKSKEHKLNYFCFIRNWWQF